MEYGLIGEKLGHSYSRELHERIGGYPYELRELKPEELGPFLQARDFRGINVTIPYKQAVMPYLDEISETAQRIGAVNTIVNRGGKLIGDNTDYDGMCALIRRCGLPVEGRKALILGTGGTSKTVRAVLSNLGAAEILRVSRSGAEGAVTYAEAAAKHKDAGIIVNTTPVGMFPNEGVSPIDLAAFPRLEGVLDAVYHPLRTELVLDAEARGLPASGGLYMLAAQAVAAAERFLDKCFDDSVLEDAFASLRREKENLVLIGMPTSGKSTVGRLLAAGTGKELLDTDELLSRRIGSVPDYIRQHGEAAFRAAEKETIASLSRESGKIIATGGGAILDEGNVRSLKRNGRLVFLDRPLSKLIPAADRPLSASEDRLRELYHFRRPLYLRAADLVISADVPPEAVAAAIRREANL